MALLNVDRDAVNKQIKRTKLKTKVVVTSVILLAAVAVWVVISYFIPQPEATNPEFTKLAAPFSFKIDQETLSLLDGKTVYTNTELSEFNIYVIDEGIRAGSSNNLAVREITGPDTGVTQVLGQEATPTPTPNSDNPTEQQSPDSIFGENPTNPTETPITE